MTLNREEKLNFIKFELEMNNTKVNHFDKLRQTTRQVCIILWSAILGISLKEKVNDIILISMFIPLPFWYTDAKYRSYCRGWEERIKALKIFLRDGIYYLPGNRLVKLSQFLEDDSCVNFPIFDYWAEKTVDKNLHIEFSSLIYNLKYLSISLIYGSMTLFSMIIFLIRM